MNGVAIAPLSSLTVPSVPLLNSIDIAVPAVCPAINNGLAA